MKTCAPPPIFGMRRILLQNVNNLGACLLVQRRSGNDRPKTRKAETIIAQSFVVSRVQARAKSKQSLLSLIEHTQNTQTPFGDVAPRLPMKIGGALAQIAVLPRSAAFSCRSRGNPPMGMPPSLIDTIVTLSTDQLCGVFQSYLLPTNRFYGAEGNAVPRGALKHNDGHECVVHHHRPNRRFGARHYPGVEKRIFPVAREGGVLFREFNQPFQCLLCCRGGLIKPYADVIVAPFENAIRVA